MVGSFSGRQGYWQAPEQLIYGDAPEEVRFGIVVLLKQICANPPYLYLVAEQCAQQLGFPELADDSRFPEIVIERLLGFYPYEGLGLWYQVYDFCEYAHSALGDVSRSDQQRFATALNALLLRNRIGWEMRDGRLERRGDVHTDPVVQETRGLQQDERYQHVNELFEKALSDRSNRPKPDWEGCVLNAAMAVHTMVQVVETRAKGHDFDSDLDLLRGRIHPALAELTKKLNAYRGDAPRVAHPGDASKRVVEADAEFVLATAAAAIIYLSKI